MTRPRPTCCRPGRARLSSGRARCRGSAGANSNVGGTWARSPSGRSSRKCTVKYIHGWKSWPFRIRKKMSLGIFIASKTFRRKRKKEKGGNKVWRSRQNGHFLLRRRSSLPFPQNGRERREKEGKKSPFEATICQIRIRERKERGGKREKDGKGCTRWEGKKWCEEEGRKVYNTVYCILLSLLISSRFNRSIKRNLNCEKKVAEDFDVGNLDESLAFPNSSYTSATALCCLSLLSFLA